MNSIFHSNFDSDSDHKPNALGDLTIPIPIPSHSDSYSHSDFGCEPHISSIQVILFPMHCLCPFNLDSWRAISVGWKVTATGTLWSNKLMERVLWIMGSSKPMFPHGDGDALPIESDDCKMPREHWTFVANLVELSGKGRPHVFLWYHACSKTAWDVHLLTEQLEL